MQLVLFSGPFILLPILITLVYKIIQVRPNNWGYIINYILLVCFVFYLFDYKPEYAPDVKGWAINYDYGISIIAIFILATISIWIQSLTRKWMF